MVTCYSDDLRADLRTMLDNEPCAAEANEPVRSGKGQVFARARSRRLLTDVRVEKTFESTDFAEDTDVVNMSLTCLYNGGEFWHFINNETFEQLSADAKTIDDSAKWLLDQAGCIAILWSGQPISVISSSFAEPEIVDTDPGLKGDTVGIDGKPAALSTGAVVKVPLLVQIGEVIEVDIRSGEYVSCAEQCDCGTICRLHHHLFRSEMTECLIVFVSFASTLFTGYNTTRGPGEDIKRLGNSIPRAAS